MNLTTKRKETVKDLSFKVSLLTSSFLNGALLLLASTLMTSTRGLTKPDFIPVELVDVRQPTGETKATAKPEKPKPTKLTAKREIRETERFPSTSPSSSAKEEAARQAETNATPRAQHPQPSAFPASAKTEGGGSKAGGEDLFGKGEIGILPGAGTGGGGGSATAGLGRGFGTPGLPAQTTILKTNRDAKPIQTARAFYPPMALRLGLEGDVALRIQIDSDGKVTKVEIIKSAGGGFDEEALRAVK